MYFIGILLGRVQGLGTTIGSFIGLLDGAVNTTAPG